MKSKQISLKSDQNGVIHHLGLILLLIAVVGIVGAVGYRVYQTNQGETISVVQEESIVVESDDADGEILPETSTEADDPVDIEADSATDSNAN